MGFFKKLSFKSIGNFVTKNIKSTVKDAGKVGGKLAPILQTALQYIPGGSTVGNILGVASNVANQANAINELTSSQSQNQVYAPSIEQIVQNAASLVQTGQATSNTQALELASKNPNFGDFIKGAGVGAVQGVLDVAKNDSNVNGALASATDNVVMAYLKKHWLKVVGLVVVIVGLGVAVKKLFFSKRTSRKRF